VFNAALQIAQHWHGDRKDVENQAQKSLTGKASFRNPDEPAVVAKLKALGYAPAFAAAFPGMTDPVGTKQAGAAIGAFERTRTTPAPFYRYLQGDDKALSQQAKAGLGLFMDLGCATCHRGAGVGGEVFQRFGLYGNYWEATGSKPIDQGRMADTKNPADQYVFKVPPLRNITKTAPYFHDGSVKTLPEAVAIMAKLQLGKTLAPKETAALVAFLSSLTGAVPQQFAPPAAP
jgi:cytochrome c peroxidase